MDSEDDACSLPEKKLGEDQRRYLGSVYSQHMSVNRDLDRWQVPGPVEAFTLWQCGGPERRRLILLPPLLLPVSLVLNS